MKATAGSDRLYWSKHANDARNVCNTGSSLRMIPVGLELVSSRGQAEVLVTLPMIDQPPEAGSVG